MAKPKNQNRKLTHKPIICSSLSFVCLSNFCCGFLRRPNLESIVGHNRNHLTHAPYRCNMCPSTSHDKGALIRHMRTHNGERPYECRDCQYAFTTKANCERHLRNRHGKVNRDALRASIIYHLSEDSAANRAAADNGSNDEGGDYYRSGNSALDLSADRDDSLDEHSVISF